MTLRLALKIRRAGGRKKTDQTRPSVPHCVDGGDGCVALVRTVRNISRHVPANENARQRVPAILNISAGARVQNRKLDRNQKRRERTKGCGSCGGAREWEGVT